MPLLEQSCGEEMAYWLGSELEIRLDLLAGRDSCQSQAQGLANLKPSQMNRVQRSLSRNRISAVAKDDTVLVAAFLMGVLDTLNVHLQPNKLGSPKSKVSEPSHKFYDHFSCSIETCKSFERHNGILVGCLRTCNQ